MPAENILTSACTTIGMQAAAINGLQQFANEHFERAVHTISKCTGRLVVSGVGKSALVAQKIVATLNSTGTPALFMHAADAIHGDLGMVQANDIVLLISKSGDSPEIKVLLPLIKNFGNTVIGMAGNDGGYLSRNCDILIKTNIEKEACPNNLAPTTSSTAQIVMGDALAICLMQQKDFGSGDFARYHPGGALGKKLYLRVRDMIEENDNPSVSNYSSIPEVIVEITKKRLGATAVMDDGKLSGIITDGDIRRMLEKHSDLSTLKAVDIMTKLPKTIEGDALAAEAYELMKSNNISQLVVVESDHYIGVLHIHDLMREGII